MLRRIVIVIKFVCFNKIFAVSYIEKKTSLVNFCTRVLTKEGSMWDEEKDFEILDEVEEYDLETWEEMELSVGQPPEDWAGSLDITPDDYGVDLDRPAGRRQGSNPLDELAPPEDIED